MFERYESVVDRVSVVTRRFRQVRFWWSIGSLAAVASLIGGCLLGPVRSGAVPCPRVALGLLIATVVAAGIALILVRLSYRNPRWVAARIESRFPGLQQRLLTALSQAPSAERRRQRAQLPTATRYQRRLSTFENSSLVRSRS